MIEKGEHCARFLKEVLEITKFLVNYKEPLVVV